MKQILIYAAKGLLVCAAALALATCTFFESVFGLRIRGVLPTSGPVANARSISPRSLISQSATIAVVLAGGEDTGAEILQTTSPDENGGFELAVIPGTGDHFMIVYDESLGVGMENLVGFIEVPAGASQSATSWPLDQASGTLDLGEISARSDVLVPSAAEAELYDQLGIDLTQLLLEAQRDDHLRDSANAYFNRNADLSVRINNYGAGASWQASINAWPDTESLAADLSGSLSFQLALDQSDDGLYSGFDVVEDRMQLRIYPPSPITLTNNQGNRSPENPLTNDDFTYFGESEEDGFALVNIEGAPPAGFWRVEINGELDGVYDFEITSPVADTGEFVYFFPLLRFVVEEETNRLVNVLRRFGYYDVELEEYAVLPMEEQVLPRFGQSWVVAGVDEMDEGFSVQLLVGMPEVDTGVFAPDSTVYLPPSGSGAERLVEVMSGYQDGEAFNIFFSYTE